MPTPLNDKSASQAFFSSISEKDFPYVANPTEIPRVLRSGSSISSPLVIIPQSGASTFQLPEILVYFNGTFNKLNISLGEAGSAGVTLEGVSFTTAGTKGTNLSVFNAIIPVVEFDSTTVTGGVDGFFQVVLSDEDGLLEEVYNVQIEVQD